MTAESEASLNRFPRKLYQALEDAPMEGFDETISWLPGENGFVIFDKSKFEQDVMPRYFQHSKWKSFLRQLNLYSFQKVHAGKTVSHRDENGKEVKMSGLETWYSHPLFQRGKPDQCNLIKRQNQRIRNDSKRKAATGGVPKSPDSHETSVTLNNSANNLSSSQNLPYASNTNAHLRLDDQHTAAPSMILQRMQQPPFRADLQAPTWMMESMSNSSYNSTSDYFSGGPNSSSVAAAAAAVPSPLSGTIPNNISTFPSVLPSEFACEDIVDEIVRTFRDRGAADDSRTI